MKSRIPVLLGLGLLVGPMTADAVLTGQQFTAGYYVPDESSLYGGASFSPTTFLVATGIETSGIVEGVTTIQVDFAEDTLDLVLNTTITPGQAKWFAAAFNGIIFTGSAAHGIMDAVVEAATNIPGFDDSRVTFDGTRILVNWQNLAYENGAEIRIKFSFVPEPTTLALFGLGLAGLGAVRRKKLAA